MSKIIKITSAISDVDVKLVARARKELPVPNNDEEAEKILNFLTGTIPFQTYESLFKKMKARDRRTKKWQKRNEVRNTLTTE